MDILKSILDIANDIATNIPLDAILAAGVLSPLVLGIKKALHLDNEKVMLGIVVLLSGLTVAGNYLLHAPTHDPSILAMQTAVLSFMTQPVYFFIVKPLIRKFHAYVEKAVQLNLDKMSATEPAAGVSVTLTPTTTDAAPTHPIQDFTK